VVSFLLRTAVKIALLGLCLNPGLLRADSPADLAEACQQFTENKLVEWKHRLTLDEWKVSIVLTKRAALKPNTLGGIRWDKKKKTAVISVMHPADYEVSEQAMLKDMEETVVHELIHLKLSALSRSEASRSSEEEAVNGIAGALLQLERESR
jgi:hypothetical protein